jgi:hypothetical protein
MPSSELAIILIECEPKELNQEGPGQEEKSKGL